MKNKYSFASNVFLVIILLLCLGTMASAQTTTVVPYYISNGTTGRDLNVAPVWNHINKVLANSRSAVAPTALVIADGGVAPHKDTTCLDKAGSISFIKGGFMAFDPLFDRIPHGTGLAELVCGQPNDVNTGLLPKDVVRIVSYKMADGSWNLNTLNSTPGNLCLECIVPAIEAFATSIPEGEIGVFNGSWGMTGQLDPSIRQAIQRYSKKIIFVFAAGNNGFAQVHEPSSYPEVICVSALDRYPWEANGKTGEQLPWFSNFDPTKVDILAYGAQISVAYPGDYYARANGTSQATPMVSAQVAFLLWEARRQGMLPGKISTTEIRQALLNGAKTIPVYVAKDFSNLDSYSDPANFANVKKADWEGSRLELQKIIDRKKSLPVISKFTAAPDTLSVGQKTTLTWSVENASTVTVEVGASSTVIPPVGSEEIAPTTTTTFKLKAAGDGGTTTTELTVVVGPKWTVYPGTVTVPPAQPAPQPSHRGGR